MKYFMLQKAGQELSECATSRTKTDARRWLLENGDDAGVWLYHWYGSDLVECRDVTEEIRQRKCDTRGHTIRRAHLY